MKTIEEMAHDYAIAMLKRGDHILDIPTQVHILANAMQEELEKLKPQQEFKIDWSQAPEWAKYWTADDLACYWWSLEPKYTSEAWHFAGGRADICNAPSFNYQGDWKDSLRHRL